MSDDLSEFDRKVLACCSHVHPRGDGARTEEYNAARAAKNLQKAALIDCCWDITTKGLWELAKGGCDAV